jgi:hypothetical protein
MWHRIGGSIEGDRLHPIIVKGQLDIRGCEAREVGDRQ